MCLIALSIGLSARFPLVVAANRDEYFDRPAAPLAWWGAPPVLAGRDLQAGGTWLGLSTAGRLAMLTNVRRPGSQRDQAPSRGDIVPLWLRCGHTSESFCAVLAAGRYNPFNCIAADLHRREVFYASSDHPAPQPMPPGLYGVSNAALDTPWPKVLQLKARLQGAVEHAESAQQIITTLFAALAERAVAPDHELPDTGVGIEWERLLSAAFIHAPERGNGGYGTRCSTVLVTENIGASCVTHFVEQGYTAQATRAQRQELRLENWPA